ncbi:hypothetical protein BpHYR1_000124 [Brachionus plicatilis]|uniref:Uncharacterized protein n=1 Tax=Brachionus plicatilis TaxID=10195 RepID=A0A3M7S8X7_BRAPC|nr:hypothetical protein BpHYR1_000124 [Brachionus plicatilis]
MIVLILKFDLKLQFAKKKFPISMLLLDFALNNLVKLLGNLNYWNTYLKPTKIYSKNQRNFIQIKIVSFLPFSCCAHQNSHLTLLGKFIYFHLSQIPKSDRGSRRLNIGARSENIFSLIELIQMIKILKLSNEMCLIIEYIKNFNFNEYSRLDFFLINIK